MNYRVIRTIINHISQMKNKHAFSFHMAFDLCNFYNRRTEGSIKLGSMYRETLRVNKDDAPNVCGILTNYTYKIQNIIQN